MRLIPLPHRHRHAFLRLALVAMLMLACAPTVSRLLAGAHGPAWAPICSAQPPDPRPGAPAHVFEHCPFCALHVDLALPPPARLAIAGPAAAPLGMPPAAVPTLPGRWHWRAAQPRAPPRGTA